jgi:hypothetical protein
MKTLLAAADFCACYDLALMLSIISLVLSSGLIEN